MNELSEQDLEKDADALRDSPALKRTAERIHAVRKDGRSPPSFEAIERDDGSAGLAFSGTSEALINLKSLASTGLRNTEACNQILLELANLSLESIKNGNVRSANESLALLDELDPQGGADTMLCAQMVAVHTASMACMYRAMRHDQTFEGRDLNLKHAAKLTSVFARQIEAREKMKRGGSQTVNVRHVHVHDGGQAMVGNVG